MHYTYLTIIFLSKSIILISSHSNDKYTVQPRLSELIGTAPSSDMKKFGYWKLKKKIV
jgi:hypothetical protein